MNTHGRPKYMTADERFWEKVDTSGDCWVWTGGTVGRTTHGRFAITSTRATVRLILPHRYAWEMRYGPIPDGLFVLHACDNGGCVRPDHLMLGSKRANSVDAARKGRLGRKKPAA